VKDGYRAFEETMTFTQEEIKKFQENIIRPTSNNNKI